MLRRKKLLPDRLVEIATCNGYTSVFEKAFQIDLGDNITRSFIDIKNRKTGQTRFLNQMQAALETKIENDLN